jgi:hypothetical protein
MTDWISGIKESARETWENMGQGVEDMKDKAGETAQKWVPWDKLPIKLFDSVEKSSSPGEGSCKPAAAFKKPAFLSAMLLDAKSEAFYEPPLQGILQGKGKTALWIRHDMLTHLRESGAGDKFLAALLACKREGVACVWNEVLERLGVAQEARPALVEKLVDETSWVALTLMQDRIQAAVLGRIDAALETAGRINKDSAFAGRVADFLLLMHKQGARKTALEMMGLDGSEAEELAALMAAKGEAAADQVKAALKACASGHAQRLEEVRDEVALMPLGKFKAMLDFQVQRDQILKGLGGEKVKDSFLCRELLKAKVDAAADRIVTKTVKIGCEIGSFVFLGALMPPAAALGPAALAEVLLRGGEILFHAPLLLHTVLEAYETWVDWKLLKKLGVDSCAL